MYRNSKVVANCIRHISRASYASTVQCSAGFARCRLPNATDSSTSRFPWNSKSSAKHMGIFHDPCSVEGIRHFRVGSGLQAGAPPSEPPAVVHRTGGPLLPPTRGRQKPRVVILGSGWGACRLLKDLNTLVYDVVCISPRNHMVFTPLLASTCVGTLEFRSVAEPVRKIQPALSLSPDSYYLPARCTSIDPEKHEVGCVSLAPTMHSVNSLVSSWIMYAKRNKLLNTLKHDERHAVERADFPDSFSIMRFSYISLQF